MEKFDYYILSVLFEHSNEISVFSRMPVIFFFLIHSMCVCVCVGVYKYIYISYICSLNQEVAF